MVVAVPRVQFLAIEVARNREGCNDTLSPWRMASATSTSHSALWAVPIYTELYMFRSVVMFTSLVLLATISLMLNRRWASCFVPTPWDLMTTPKRHSMQSLLNSFTWHTEHTKKMLISSQPIHSPIGVQLVEGTYRKKVKNKFPGANTEFYFIVRDYGGLGPVLRSGGLTQENLWTLMCKSVEFFCILTGN